MPIQSTNEMFKYQYYINRYKMENKEILRYPRLDTVLMVEKTTEKYSGECGRYQLWNKLPKKMMYQTFLLILNYLETSGKVLMTKNEKVMWIWNPRLIQRLQNENLIIK